MTTAEAIKTCFDKYATFDGRAGRAEFWGFFAFSALVNLTAWFLWAVLSDGDLLGVFAALSVLFPTLAVTARRLHDTGRPATWLAAGVIPLLGQAILIYFCSQPGDPGENAFGPAPA